MSNEKKDFEILFRDIYPKLYYAAMQLVKDEEVCRDIIADSFEQLWTKRAAVEPENVQVIYTESSTTNASTIFVSKRQGTSI